MGRAGTFTFVCFEWSELARTADGALHEAGHFTVSASSSTSYSSDHESQLLWLGNSVTFEKLIAALILLEEQ